jgi:hypothetical protein
METLTIFTTIITTIAAAATTYLFFPSIFLLPPSSVPLYPGPESPKASLSVTRHLDRCVYEYVLL